MFNRLTDNNNNKKFLPRCNRNRIVKRNEIFENNTGPSLKNFYFRPKIIFDDIQIVLGFITSSF